MEADSRMVPDDTLEVTLRVADPRQSGPGAVATYEHAYIKREDFKRTEQVSSGGAIEVGSVELYVLAESFFGASSPLELPGRGPGGEVFQARASIELGGHEVFSGTVSKSGLAVDPPDDFGRRSWAVQVEATALERVMGALKERAVYAPDLLRFYQNPGLLNAGFVSVHSTMWPEAPGGDPQDLRWYDLAGLWRAQTSTMKGVRLESQIALFPHPYTGARMRPRVISLFSGRVSQNGEITFAHTLPDWTGRNLLEAVQGLTGMRLAASYDPFPSSEIYLEEIEGAWRPPPNLPALGEQRGLERYDLGTEEAPEADFALYYDGAREETRSYAALRPLPFEEGGPANAGVQRIPMQLARFPGDTETFDVEWEGGFKERVYTGTPHVESEGAWISAYDLGPSVSIETYLASFREPLPRPSGNEPPALFNELWLGEHLHRHALRAAPQHVLSGPFDATGLPLEAGRPEKGVRVEGVPWIVRSTSELLKSRQADLELARPVGEFEAGRQETQLFERPPSGVYYYDRYNKLFLFEWNAVSLRPARYRFRFSRAGRGYFGEATIAPDRRRGLHFEEEDEDVDQSSRLAEVRAEYDLAGGWASPWLVVYLDVSSLPDEK